MTVSKTSARPLGMALSHMHSTAFGLFSLLDANSFKDITLYPKLTPSSLCTPHYSDLQTDRYIMCVQLCYDGQLIWEHIQLFTTNVAKKTTVADTEDYHSLAVVHRFSCEHRCQ